MGSKASVGYRSRSGSVFIDMAAAPGVVADFGSPAKRLTSTIPEENFQFMPWAPWGISNNLLPQEMTRDIETCGVLEAIIDGKARFAMGEGIAPAIVKSEGSKKIVESILLGTEVNDWMEMNDINTQGFDWHRDLYGMGNAMARLIVNREGNKIHTLRRDDVSETRKMRQDPSTGKITHVFHSACWDRVTGANDNRIFKLPLVNELNPLEDLTEKIKNGAKELNYGFRRTAWGKHYYSAAQWYAAYKWVKIAQGVPEMKAAMFENNMRLKYKVIIYKDYWTNAFEDWEDVDDKTREARKNTLYDEIDAFLTGSKNAYKSIYVEGEYTLDGEAKQYIDIVPIEDSTKPGELLPDSAAANSEIAIANLWNNAMTGGNQKSGLYGQNEGGSSVREASTMQVIVLENERQKIVRLLNIVKKFNGWDKTYPGLEFIIPGTILTTLDTGGSTKPVINGGAAPGDSKKDE